MSTAFDVISSFKEVLEKGNLLKRHLIDLQTSQIWINQGKTGFFENDLNNFIDALLDYSYENISTQQSCSATVSYQGALGGELLTLELALKLNHAKDKFRALCKELMKEQNQKKTTLIHKILKQAGFVSLKLKQVYRHIPLIDYHPRLISYCQIKHNSKIKISKEAAKEKLIKVGKGANIDVQLDWLEKTDCQLVIHRETPAIWAVNVSSFKTHTNRVITEKIITSLPVLYLMNGEYPLPIVQFSEKRIRSGRNDRTIEENAFLKSIHAYKYK